MATNWTVAMGFEALINGTEEDKLNFVADASKRFPRATYEMAMIAAVINDSNAKETFNSFIKAMPSYITLRKIEGILRNGADEEEPEAEEVVKETTEPAPKKRGKKAKVAEPEPEVEEAEETEEEEEEPAPKKKAAKAKAKKEENPAKAKKVKKVVEEDDDDDEDDEWDL